MKTALITGASDGIGLEVAKRLAANGYMITLVARSQEKLEKAKASLAGDHHQCVVTDLSQKVAVDGLRGLIDQNHYDVFINNAGVGMYGHFHEMPLSEQVKMMNVNMTAVTALSLFYLSQAKRGDALVNVASTLGTTTFPGAAAYAGSKAFVSVFSESLWWEYKKQGIYVLGFCPGATATAFHQISGRNMEIFPSFVLQKPESVARELVSALFSRKKPKVISGGVNRAMLTLQRFMTRRAVTNMMGGFGPLKD